MIEILISDNYTNNNKKSNFSSLGIFELEMRDGIQLFPIDYNVLDDISIKNRIKAIKIIIKSTYGENKTYINQIMFYENTAKEIISYNENENENQKENELIQSQNETCQKELNLPGDLSNSQISEEEKGQQIDINEHNKNIKKYAGHEETKENNKTDKENIKVEENNNINSNDDSNNESNNEEVENEDNSDDNEENKIISSSDELKEPQVDNYKKRYLKNKEKMRQIEKKQNLKKTNNNYNYTKSKKVKKIEKILKENILNNDYKKMNQNETYLENLNHNRTQDFVENDDKYNSKYNYNKHRTISNVDDYPSLTPLIKKKFQNENNYNISNRNSNEEENNNVRIYFKINEPSAKRNTINGYEYLINKKRPNTPNMREVKRNAIPGQNKLLDEYKNRTTMNGFSHISNVNDNNAYETLEMQLQDMEQYLKNMALNKDINSNSNYSKSNREEQVKENNYYNNDIYINNNFIDKKSKHQSFISNNSNNYKNNEIYEPKDLNTNNINYNNNEELKYNSDNINMNNDDDSTVNRRIDNLEKNIFEIKNALNDISSNLKVFLDKETFLYNFKDSIKQICYDFFSSRINNFNNEENNIYSDNNQRINNEIENENENENEEANNSQYSGEYSGNKDNQNENRNIEEEINKKIDEKLEYLCDNLQNQIFEKYLQPSINEIEKSMKQNIEDIKEKVDSINCTNISVKKTNIADESQISNKYKNYDNSSYLKYKNYSQISNNDIFNNNSSIIKKEKCEEINRLGEKLYKKLLEKEKKLKLLKQETNMLMSIKNSQNNLNDDN